MTNELHAHLAVTANSLLVRSCRRRRPLSISFTVPWGCYRGSSPSLPKPSKPRGFSSQPVVQWSADFSPNYPIQINL